MLDETAAELTKHLEHPNGWWRDTAQKLLVLNKDKSVVPALQNMARNSATVLGRFHALWALEGLGALDAPLAREMMRDLNPLVRVQAIRASETLYKAADKPFEADYTQLTKDPDTRVTSSNYPDPSRCQTSLPSSLRRVETGPRLPGSSRHSQSGGERVGRGGGRERGDAEQHAPPAMSWHLTNCVPRVWPDGKACLLTAAPAAMKAAPSLDRRGAFALHLRGECVITLTGPGRQYDPDL